MISQMEGQCKGLQGSSPLSAGRQFLARLSGGGGRKKQGLKSSSFSDVRETSKAFTSSCSRTSGERNQGLKFLSSCSTDLR